MLQISRQSSQKSQAQLIAERECSPLEVPGTVISLSACVSVISLSACVSVISLSACVSVISLSACVSVISLSACVSVHYLRSQKREVVEVDCCFQKNPWGLEGV